MERSAHESDSRGVEARTASPWLTTTTAAEYLGCTPGTLKTWRAAGSGPKYHGRHRFVRYHVADLTPSS
jgi:hypothetical protein